MGVRMIYINRKGVKYYLHYTITYTGSTFYYFSKRPSVQDVKLPVEYMVVENRRTGFPHVKKKRSLLSRIFKKRKKK